METVVISAIVIAALAARVWAGFAFHNFIEEQPAAAREQFRRALARGTC